MHMTDPAPPEPERSAGETCEQVCAGEAVGAAKVKQAVLTREPMVVRLADASRADPSVAIEQDPGTPPRVDGRGEESGVSVVDDWIEEAA